MKYTLIDSVTLYEILDYMNTLSIDEYTKEKYTAALVSENVQYEMAKTPYNSHPTDFEPKHLTEVDEIIAKFIGEKWKPVLNGLNCKLMCESLRRASSSQRYYFPITAGIRREIKLYITFGNRDSINKLKLKKPDVYNNMIPIGRHI